MAFNLLSETHSELNHYFKTTPRDEEHPQIRYKCTRDTSEAYS